MAFRIPVISDLIDKIQQSNVSKAIASNPDVQRVALQLSERPKELSKPVPIVKGFGKDPQKVVATVPKGLLDFMGHTEQYGSGFGKFFTERPVQAANFFANLGSKTTGIKSPKIKETAISDLLIPKPSPISKQYQKEYGDISEKVGRGTASTLEFYGLSGAIKGLPGVVEGMEKLYKITDPLIKSNNPITRTIGSGLANVVEGLPYGVAARVRRMLEGSDTVNKLVDGEYKGLEGVKELSKDLAGEGLFDIAIGALASNAPGPLKNLGYTGAGRPAATGAVDPTNIKSILKDQSGFINPQAEIGSPKKGSYEEILNRLNLKQSEASDKMMKLFKEKPADLNNQLAVLNKEMSLNQPADVINYKNIISDPKSIPEKKVILDALSQRYPNEPFFQQHKSLLNQLGFANFSAEIGGEKPVIPTPENLPIKPYDPITGMEADYSVYKNLPEGADKNLAKQALENDYVRQATAMGKMPKVPTPVQIAKEYPIDTKIKRLQELKDLGIYSDTGEITPDQAGQLNKILPTGAYSATPEGAAERLFKQEQKQAAGDILKEIKTKDSEKIKAIRNEIEEGIEGVSNSIRQNTKGVVAKALPNAKDLNRLDMSSATLTRNMEKAFGKDYAEVDRTVLAPFRASKGQMATDITTDATDIYENVVKKLGIAPKSKLSAVVQDYGEGKITIEELQKQYPKQWNNVVEADNYFRNFYDRWLKSVNETRAIIYPNQPDKLIPFRKDYYRHFKEFETGFGGLKNIFDSPANISSNLTGVSDYTEPKTKFLSFALRRTGTETEKDAVGGALNYLKAASYAKNIDPNISNFRSLAKDLADANAELPAKLRKDNLVEYLNDFSNDLAGKTNPYDRSAQKLLGRKVFKALDWINSRVKANTVLGNVSSSVSQIFNVPNGIADTGYKNSTLGFADYIRQSAKGSNLADEPIFKSNFIKTRYDDDIFDKFDTGVMASGKNFAKWMTSALDRVGTKWIWNAEYRKALSEGAKNPVDFADVATEKMVAGRGIGEVPLLQKARVTQLVAAFQVEVNNAWYVMRDFVSKKEYGKLVTLALMNHMFNKAAKAIKGSPVVFDPIQAAFDSFESGNPMRMGGEVIGNLPFGQTLAEVYPEYGVTVPVAGLKTPTRKELFGGQSPTRFGTAPLAIKGLQDPIFKLLLPYGGMQVEKTLQGLQSLDRGGVYTAPSAEAPEGKLKFPVEGNLPNVLRSILFGQYSTPEAQEYFKNNVTPLGVGQTKTVTKSADPTRTYQKILQQRKVNAEKKKKGTTTGRTGRTSTGGGTGRGGR